MEGNLIKNNIDISMKDAENAQEKGLNHSWENHSLTSLRKK
jgi:hypothetical protein